MQYRITHITEYEYDAPVQLEPHIVRLRPRGGNGIRPVSFDLDVHPQPLSQHSLLDAGGNQTTALHFHGTTRRLEIVASCTVDCHAHNPFQFILHPFSASSLPLAYEPEIQPLLAPYLIRCSTNVPVTAFASALAQEVNGDTLSFLTALNQRIFHLCECVVRKEGAPRQPARTLEKLRGSCRDLAVLFADACRSLGIAARFVSGYLLDDRDDAERHLHAWAEVYLPGAGWRAYDPALGIAVQEQHVALAAGRLSRLAAPVTGSFRGGANLRKFESSIHVAPVAEPALSGGVADTLQFH